MVGARGRMGPRMTLGVSRAWVLLVAAAGACRQPTQITIEVTTDTDCSDPTETGISVGRASRSVKYRDKPVSTWTTHCAEGYIGDLVLTPSGAKDGWVAFQVTTAIGDPAKGGPRLSSCLDLSWNPTDLPKGYGCVWDRRALRFRPHENTVVPVRISASCLNVECPEAQTCFRGECVDRVDQSTPEGARDVAGDGGRSGLGDGGFEGDLQGTGGADSTEGSGRPNGPSSRPGGAGGESETGTGGPRQEETGGSSAGGANAEVGGSSAGVTGPERGGSEGGGSGHAGTGLATGGGEAGASAGGTGGLGDGGEPPAGYGNTAASAADNPGGAGQGGASLPPLSGGIAGEGEGGRGGGGAGGHGGAGGDGTAGEGAGLGPGGGSAGQGGVPSGGQGGATGGSAGQVAECGVPQRSCSNDLTLCGPERESCCQPLLVQGLLELGRGETGSDAYPFAEPESDEPFANEVPEVTVEISRFRLDKYEVTVSRFRAFMEDYDDWRPACPGPGDGGDSARNRPALDADLPETSTSAIAQLALCGGESASPYHLGIEDAAVICVQWEVAAAFCIWDGGWLPTEAEWELAAAGTSDLLYPWGADTPSAATANYSGNPAASPILAVGSFPDGAGPFSHRDLAGGVEEWVLDAFDPAAYARWVVETGDPPFLDPMVAEDPDPAHRRRILRGGSYLSPAVAIRAAVRSAVEPPVTNPAGFRCAYPAE